MQSQIHSDRGRVRIAERAQPLLRQRAPEIQPYGTLAQTRSRSMSACGRLALRP